MIFRNYKEISKPLMMQVSLKILPVKNWRASVEKIHDSESQVRDVLQDLLKQKSQMLTEGIVASRNGRQVLPVKNTYRNKIAGVVHDISASRNTVYIEPREVVKLSEEIASLRADERYEILRILQEILSVSALTRLRLPMMLGLSAIWT